ncbi:MAG: 3-hydroxy-3-methylglutaryl-CoA reductase [Chlorobi bacterium]|nr:3-hydroxy-3-methylglutaryl-CoA reductase [Chlorobiota bacterium]
MATSSRGANKTIGRLLADGTIEEIAARLGPVSPDTSPLPPEVPDTRNWSSEGTARRRSFLEGELGRKIPWLGGEATLEDDAELRGNIEHFIGMTMVPTGIIGPLRINGVGAKGDFYVPLATTEGALVASYHRGASIVSRAGGVTSICLVEGVQRSPSFRFRTFMEVGTFLIWVMGRSAEFQSIVSKISSHARLEDIRSSVDGNQITLVLDYNTGDAAGQNMVTICTDAVCRHIVEHAPVKPVVWYVEGNLSGDKKATAISFTTVRGKKVTAEALIPRPLVERGLHTTPEEMMGYWKTSVLNGIQSGSIGVNGHFANGLTAIFLACGQDAACVAEAAVGTTRFDVIDGDLYVCVTLPNLIVGTVGGGTGLPTQRECLELLGCRGDGTARKFAEICAATILCGEISIVGAIAAGDFAKAHALFGRRRNGARP